MRPAGLLALPVVLGLVARAVGGAGMGIAVAIGSLVAVVVSLVVLTPGRGRDIAAGGAVSDAASGWAEFHRELARARRFERPFSIVRLAGGPDVAGDALTTARDGVAATARRTDRAWIDGDDVLVLLPETAPATVARFVERLVAEAAAGLTPSVASFPDDGITSGALISVVYGGEAPVPVPIGTVRPDPRPVQTGSEELPVPEVVSHGG